MSKTKHPIWLANNSCPDTYGEFLGQFRKADSGRVYLNIACDGKFAAYLNEKLIFFGESADYPHYKLYHRKDITGLCGEENRLRICVWYCGVDSQTAIKSEPGLVFEVVQAGNVLLESNEGTLSRVMEKYENGYCKTITTQLGLSWLYDNTRQETAPFLPSLQRGTPWQLHRRKTGVIPLGKRAAAAITKTQQGYLVDLGEETVGFLELDFVSDICQKLVISYGEHLVDGQVPRRIGERDFSVEFVAKAGENRFLHPFLRLAGRYLEIQTDGPIAIGYVGLRPTDRRVRKIKRTFKDPLLQNIYDTSVNTLHKCMHEHYEDCPWREQAMYALDSRNQMLCGYYAFRGHYYQRENILFMGKGQRQDGLLSLCFPAGKDIPIPFFSLAYVMAVNDYVTHTQDQTLLEQIRPVLLRIMQAFRERIDETGLIPNFPYPCWNFYEWTDGSHNEHETTRKPQDQSPKQYDFILNSMYVYAEHIYGALTGQTRDTASMAATLHNTFYDPARGLYKLSTANNCYSQLGNSFALLIGMGGEALAEKIMTDKQLIPVTLSMNVFYYDALLSLGQRYLPHILQDIKTKFGTMLEKGATTFWETEKGWEDFEGAGSMCHGWSAICAYYLPEFFGDA